MASKNSVEPIIYQFRFYGTDNENNVPNDENFWLGQAGDINSSKTKDLLSNYGAAVKIGIQTLPGVRFHISNSNFSNGIIIDHTGVYELDLRNTTTSISNLFFDIDSLNRINEIDNASLIVDILYNPKDGAVNS